ncbi:unnamed protein product [Lepidochelys kempii]
MVRLMDIVLCLAKGGRPFRSHNEKADSFERGLFLNHVNMLQKYDPVMAKHVQQSPWNATYLSNRIQNDLNVALHKLVQQKIVSVLNGKMVSIIADDTTDCGYHEQMYIVVRYFDNEKHSPVEHFVSVLRLLTVDAQSIFDQLNDVLDILNIDWSSVMSVCFDGASTMSGCTVGVHMKCKERNSEIFYVHCYAHCLNLVLEDACTASKQNRTVFDFFSCYSDSLCLHGGESCVTCSNGEVFTRSRIPVEDFETQDGHAERKNGCCKTKLLHHYTSFIRDYQNNSPC